MQAALNLKIEMQLPVTHIEKFKVTATMSSIVCNKD